MLGVLLLAAGPELGFAAEEVFSEDTAAKEDVSVLLDEGVLLPTPEESAETTEFSAV